jgi:serine/threonine protein kinase
MFSLDTAMIISRKQPKELVIGHKDEDGDDTCKTRSKRQSNLIDSITMYCLTNMRTDAFHDRYDVVEKIGNGSMGTISSIRIKTDKIGGSAFECKCKGFFGYSSGRKKIVTARKDRPKCSSSYHYALKTLQTCCSTSNYVDEMHNEVTMLRSCDHPNIIRAFEVYESKKKRDLTSQIYLVLELCTGGDLFTRSPYSRREAAEIASKVISAVNYMHRRNIVHRDIKYENILFESDESTSDVKIIDFGLSKCLANHSNPEKMCDRVGTTYTMAPEVLRRGYSSQADMWSIGVVAYMVCSIVHI